MEKNSQAFKICIYQRVGLIRDNACSKLDLLFKVQTSLCKVFEESMKSANDFHAFNKDNMALFLLMVMLSNIL